MIRNLKYGIKNLIIFFRVVWNFRPWDYVYTLELFQAGLMQLLHCLEDGSEIDETRLPKVKAIKRAIKILDNIIKDKYWSVDDFRDYKTLQDDEFNELRDILFSNKEGQDIRSWWD